MGEDRAIEAGGGRMLACREYGEPEGAVVIYCHGGLACGLDVAPFDAAARAPGLLRDRLGVERAAVPGGRWVLSTRSRARRCFPGVCRGPR